MNHAVIKYVVNLSTGKLVLWCYFVWYCVTLYFYFDSSIRIWLNSIGISMVVGIALTLSVSANGRRDYWQTFRLFLMPFCVSSFSSLIKGQGYFLIIPPKRVEQLVAVSACAILVLIVYALKRWIKAAPSTNGITQSEL